MFHEFIYEFGCTKVPDGPARAGLAIVADMAPGPADGTSQGGRGGHGPARAGLAFADVKAPGPGDGTSAAFVGAPGFQMARVTAGP